jgi:hypothetical protein
MAIEQPNVTLFQHDVFCIDHHQQTDPGDVLISRITIEYELDRQVRDMGENNEASCNRHKLSDMQGGRQVQIGFVPWISRQVS